MLSAGPLLTLTGPGGVGKTRLALELGSELLSEFDDGVWVIEVGSVADPDVLGSVFATTLMVPEQLGRPMIAAVAEHLASRHALLIVDDCEHLLGAVAEAADVILRSAEDIRIIVTSREPLGLAGEAVYPVPPLTAPAADEPYTGDAIAQFEACRLFAERCIAAQPSFRVTDANVQAIAQICRRLDGIPLALELAAARSRALPVEQIAIRLNDRFQLLTGGSRNALPRHQTLRATMDWSYDLLSDREKAVLHRLSVFAGGCTLEAAESVCAGEPVEAFDVLDLVTRLVDRSLVQAQASGEEGRFTMLETVREYALERLIQAGEADTTRRRHRDWYLALAEEARPAFFRGPEPRDWLERLDREHDNLRAALGWSEGSADEYEAGLRLATGLWRFWEIRGHLGEGRSWLERFLGPSDGSVTARRADALTGAGILALMQGDHAAALSFHEESLALQRKLGDEKSIAYALNNLANAAVQQGEHERAKELYLEALEIAKRRGDRHGTAFTLSHLSDVASRAGDYDGARDLFEQSVALFRYHDDRWGMAFALSNFALAARRHGDAPAARALNEEAIQLSRELGDVRGVARGLGNLADVALGEGDGARARSLYLECIDIRQSLGDAPGLATALEKLAWAIAPDEPELSASLVGAADSVRETIRAPIAPSARDEHDRGVRDLGTRLGEEKLLAARRQGRELGADGVLARLLP
jgi:predicted ATPase